NVEPSAARSRQRDRMGADAPVSHLTRSARMAAHEYAFTLTPGNSSRTRSVAIACTAIAAVCVLSSTLVMRELVGAPATRTAAPGAPTDGPPRPDPPPAPAGGRPAHDCRRTCYDGRPHHDRHDHQDLVLRAALVAERDPPDHVAGPDAAGPRAAGPQ